MKLGRKRAATEEITGAEHVARVVGRSTIPVGLGQIMLTGDTATDSLNLREEFHIQLIELADQFDHLDHELRADGGSELQNDCKVIGEITRKEMHPRFHEAFKQWQRETLDAEILGSLVAGPNAK